MNNIGLNSWWWKRSEANEKIAIPLSVAGTLILVLAFSPFVSEWIGNLSIREIYSMPTASEITFTGHVQSDFLRWKFVDVLVKSVLYIANLLPLF